jgi:TATA-box binding protein (TBP) (component of TFIID and TFIIIB)
MTRYYKQTNHVILAQTHGRRSLIGVFNKLGYGKYRPKTYSALTQRFINPKATAIVFSTGNITNMGCNSYFGALRVLLSLKRRLGLEFMNVKLTNIVVSFSTKEYGTVDLLKFFEQNRGYCTYDPGIFPCVTFGIPGSKIKANIFKSGNVVIAGCKTRAAIESTISSVVEKIRQSLTTAHYTDTSARMGNGDAGTVPAAHPN